MLTAFSIAPAGPDAGDSFSEAVAGCVRLVRESGLANETNAMFTLVEGEWDETMALLKRCVDLLEEQGASRVGLVLKIDHRPGHTGMLRSKVDRVEAHLDRGE